MDVIKVTYRRGGIDYELDSKIIDFFEGIELDFVGSTYDSNTKERDLGFWSKDV